MGEIIAKHYCQMCGRDTHHMYAASGRKGECMKCDTPLPRDERVNFHEIISECI